MAPSLEQIAYDAALRALDKQEAVVAELRARSGVLLAAASVAVSLFSRLSVLALAAYLVTVGTSLVVLVPRASLRFSISARSAIDRLDPIRGDSRSCFDSSSMRFITCGSETTISSGGSCACNGSGSSGSLRKS